MASNNQATDDSWSFSEGVFTGSFFFDVLANDSIKKPLYSIDNGQVADLGTADLARSAAASSDRSALGATIWITGDGRIGYSADSLHDLVDQLGQGETLTDSFLYAVRQGNTLVWATARLTITGTNDAPVATADVAAANEDMLVTGSVAANDHDVDHGAVLTYSQIGTTPGFAMASNGNWAFDGSDPAYQSLGAGESMQVAISYSVTDEHGAAASSVLAVTVTGTNDAVRVEYAVQDAWLAEDGGSMAGTIVFSDADLGDVHSVSVTPASNEAAVGTFVLDPVQPYDPAGTSYVSWHYLLNSSDSLQFLNEGEEISEQYVVTISDGHGGSVDQTITVVMRGSDDAPISEPAFAVASEDVVTSGRYTSSDIDHDATLTYSLYSQFPATYVPGFSIGADGTWSLDGNNPEIQSLAEGQTVSLVLHIVATDEYGMFDINELTISLTGKNDAAVIGGNATGSVAESAPGNPGVAQSSGQLTVADVDGNAGFRAVGNAVSDGGHGTFSLSATGSWIYTLNNNDPAVDHLNSGQQLTDSFKVVAVDGTQSSVTITIAGANDFSLPTEYLGTDDPTNNDNIYLAPYTEQTRFTGTAGPDVIGGSWFSDTIFGLDGNDVLMGEDGNDQFLGGAGNDQIYGQKGGDVLSGGTGDDQMWAGSSNDDMAGQDGNDILYGGSGWDYLDGNNGNDMLFGGFGHDNLSGGAGFDWFVYRDVKDTNDLISDFTFGQDTLDFRSIDANAQAAGDQVFGWSGSNASANSMWAAQQGADFVLYADTDGNVATVEFMVTLQNFSMPIASDPFVGIFL